MEPCKHEKLHFGSGGYYIFCSVCHYKWVACRNDQDAPDYENGCAMGLIASFAKTGPLDHLIVHHDLVKYYPKGCPTCQGPVVGNDAAVWCKNNGPDCYGLMSG